MISNPQANGIPTRATPTDLAAALRALNPATILDPKLRALAIRATILEVMNRTTVPTTPRTPTSPTT